MLLGTRSGKRDAAYFVALKHDTTKFLFHGRLHAVRRCLVQLAGYESGRMQQVTLLNYARIRFW